MLVNPNHILPSQDFLKEGTVRFILECLENGNTSELPPTPLVRQDGNKNLVAIDGHNLIAVMAFRGQPLEVIVATSPDPVFPETSEANRTRNQELAGKFTGVLTEQQKVAAQGVTSFSVLINKYPHLFAA